MEWQRGTVLESTSDYGGLLTLNYQDKSAEDTAVYLQNIWKPDNKWTITPGVRYDHYNRFGGQISPKLQVNYSADTKTDYYAS